MRKQERNRWKTSMGFGGGRKSTVRMIRSSLKRRIELLEQSSGPSRVRVRIINFDGSVGYDELQRFGPGFQGEYLTVWLTRISNRIPRRKAVSEEGGLHL